MPTASIVGGITYRGRRPHYASIVHKCRRPGAPEMHLETAGSRLKPFELRLPNETVVATVGTVGGRGGPSYRLLVQEAGNQSHLQVPFALNNMVWEIHHRHPYPISTNLCHCCVLCLVPHLVGDNPAIPRQVRGF